MGDPRPGAAVHAYPARTMGKHSHTGPDGRTYSHEHPVPRLLTDEQVAERVAYHLSDGADPLPTRLRRIAWLLGAEGYRYDPAEDDRVRTEGDPDPDPTWDAGYPG